MTFNVDDVIDATIKSEGGYSNNPADAGGETNFGITIRVARANGYLGAMRSLGRDEAKRIYKSEFWDAPGFGRVFQISPLIAQELFDTGVNMGPTVPALWLQQCLNAFNNQGRLYPDIAEDADKPTGGIGPKTITALQSFLAARLPQVSKLQSERVMLQALNGLQAARYLSLARSRPANEAFAFGWLLNRVSLV